MLDIRTRIKKETQAAGIPWSAGILLIVASSIIAVLGFIWNKEEELFEVENITSQVLATNQATKVTGSTTVAVMIEISNRLLGKRGGYISNDIVPPGVWMDNVPNWEFGVLVQLRDMARTMRNNFSRSQSQSMENPALVVAENQFYFDSNSWMLPATESEYRKGIRELNTYLVRLGSTDETDAQFYARADNLGIWLSEVETRLGSLSQRLSASIGKRQINTSLAGDSAAKQSTNTSMEIQVKTPWLELDDIFYEARGTTWGLIHLLKAIEIDFQDVLEKKNASVSLQHIIRELEASQETLWSPVVLNGSGFGIVANHSLVMGSHISRANAAIIELRDYLKMDNTMVFYLTTFL